MSITIFHQTGHNAVWNKDSLVNDKIGDGLIFSPVHEDSDKVSSYSKKIKSSSIFDPQFYLPSSGKNKFKTYSFFPGTIAGNSGFRTVDYASLAMDSARQCVEFQLKNDFKYLVIPARFFEQLDQKYTEQQEELFVAPFLKAIHEAEISEKKDILITLPITSHMIASEDFKADLLNWATSFSEIDGIYLIYQCDRKTKQIQNEHFLFQLMDALKALLDTDLKIIIGYTNTEGLLYTLTGDLGLTIGSFENTRIFSLDKFIVSDEEKRGPKARIYTPGLLNWIDFEHAKIIKESAPDLWNVIHNETEYSEQAFKLARTPTFNNPLLYKHYFQVYSKQLNSLSSHSPEKRYGIIRDKIRTAISNHDQIKDIPIDLDRHGNDDHLQPWLNAINKYYAKNLKKLDQTNKAVV